jgi:DNA-binding response OmpR family regulator
MEESARAKHDDGNPPTRMVGGAPQIGNQLARWWRVSLSGDVVAVFNTSQDTTDLLRQALEEAGFVVVTAFTTQLRDGKIEYSRFIGDHQPKVIVYDIAIPYDRNWALFQHFRSLPASHAVQFVITTGNAAQVRHITGRDVLLHEIVGKPYDLAEMVSAVKEAAARARATR